MKPSSELLGIDLPWDIVQFPVIASIKYDGLRFLATPEGMLSSTLKPFKIKNPELAECAEQLVNLCKQHQIVLEGEFEAESYTCSEMLSVRANKLPPKDTKFLIFNYLTLDEWNGSVPVRHFLCRSDDLRYKIFYNFNPSERVKPVYQIYVSSMEDLELVINWATSKDEEGLILASPTLQYKHGRCTPKEATFLKWKRYSDFIDAKVIGYTRREERNKDIETGYKPDGTKEACYSKDDKHKTNIPAMLVVMLEDGTEETIPFPKGMSFADRLKWAREYDYNKDEPPWVRFRGMVKGKKDKCRIVKCVEWRDEK